MIFALVLAAGGPADAPWDCKEPMPQQEMNYCAAVEYDKVDAALNVQWKLTAAAMKQRDDGRDATYDQRPGYFATLLDGQRAWLKYRDAHCRSEGYYARGGSLESLLVSTCRTKLTEQRTQQLQFLIEQ